MGAALCKIQSSILLFIYLLISPFTIAAEPVLNKQNIFTAGEGGYDVYRIPGVVVTTKGTVLAYCEALHNTANLCIATFNIEWPTNGKDSLTK